MRLTDFDLLQTAVLLLVLGASSRACATELEDIAHTPQNQAELAKPGDHLGVLEHDRLKRTYRLHVPAAVENKARVPLVLVFHGGMGTAKHASESYGWSEKADKEGFIVAYPDGTGVFQTWNAMHGCGSAMKNKVDDVGFIKVLVAELQKKLPVDPGRIYVTGISNGAFLSYRLAAECSEIFAAAAPVAGSIGGKVSADHPEVRIPEAAEPVAIIIIHGKKDGNVCYEGGKTRKGIEPSRWDVSVADSAAFWVKVNSCETKPEREELTAGKVLKQSYLDKRNGKDVVIYSLENGGHSWPGGKPSKLKLLDPPSPDLNATDVIWEFFKTHPRK